MEQLKNDTYKNELWQQVLVKIRNAANDKRAKDQYIMNKVRSIIEKEKATRNLTQK
ncbi:hypothetical protein [Pedobacter hiemivivus]|uniref:hypothetical protein n=1 Tax=Pedobacter hiemivivus TaxID=2530454 RepID=UPI0013F144B6|nr:hypothetical protein [Pedobacter hiemivivus]